MIVSFIFSQFRKNHEGLKRQVPNLIEKLNAVIDFENSTYPSKWIDAGESYKKETLTPDKFFEGREKKLRPEDMFVYDGQIFSIDSEDTIGFWVSETGGKALDRFIEDILEVEYKFKSTQSNSINVKISEESPNEDILSKIRIPYYSIKSINIKCNTHPKTLKIVFENPELCLGEVTLFLNTSKGDIWYNPDEVFEDQINYLSQDILSWLYNNYRYENSET